MATKKLYWDDPRRFSFEAGGATLAQWEGRPALVLEQTVFYAEGGGQLGDTGVLRFEAGREARVVDTQIDDAGVIHHVLEAALDTAPVGSVRGELDVPRRKDMTAHHTAQHVLSRAMLDAARAPTASARLGAGACTIDFDKANLADAALYSAEDLVNSVVRDDVEVRAFFPTNDELAGLDLRRAPKVDAGVRIVQVGDFDLTPCGGTHVTRTGQIGAVRVVATERYKGKVRVTFVAAARTMEDARRKDALLAELTGELTCGPADLAAGVRRLRAELTERTEALGRARGELARRLAEELLASTPADPSGTTLVRVTRQGDDVGALRTLAARLAERPDVVAVCGAREPGGDVLVVVQRGAGTGFDCGAWLKAEAARLGGRGGGRPERAEGKLPAAGWDDQGAPTID